MATNQAIQKLLDDTYEETTAIGILKCLGVQDVEQTFAEKLKEAIFKNVIKSFSYTLANDLLFENTLDSMEKFEKSQMDIKEKRRYFGKDLPNIPIEQIEKIYDENDRLSENYQKLKHGFLTRYERAQSISNKIKNLCKKQIDDWNDLKTQHAEDICNFLTYKDIPVTEEFFHKLTEMLKNKQYSR